mgnify:FL=1
MSSDLLQALYELATEPGKGIVALTWIVMANTIVGVVIALLRREFAWDRLLNFLGGERVLVGGIVLALIYAGFRVGLPLLPFYQFVAGAIAISAGADLITKLGAYFTKKE